MSSYNPALGLRGLSVPASPRRAGTRCDIAVDEAIGAPARYRYMYTPLEERAASLEKGLLSLQVCASSRLVLPCLVLSGMEFVVCVIESGVFCCVWCGGRRCGMSTRRER